MKNKYQITYLEDGVYTSHSFDTITELKLILNGLNVKVNWKFHCNTFRIIDLCINHNVKFVSI
jgi:hypothetical protein